MTGSVSILPLALDDFPHVREQRTRLLLTHWLERRGDSVAPARTAIDPAAILAILPDVWICDFLPAEDRFRMRLAGEEINQVYGGSIRSKYFEDIITPAMLPELNRRYRRVIEVPAILHCSGQIYLASGRSVVGERLVLPLLDESGAVMHAIGASVFERGRPDLDGPPTQETMTETYTPLCRPPSG